MKKTPQLKASMYNDCIECGCDEAGRGCLAGPVFASAVILPTDFQSDLIFDSKTLSKTQRLKARKEIEKHAIAYAVASCDEKEIDIKNILWASIEAMTRAILNLTVRPEHILVDGNRFKSIDKIPHTCVIKGDSKFLSIAAASILAKTYRDEYMEKIDKEFPIYGWQRNNGYPTLEHRRAIESHGICKYHRKSFRICQPKLDFKS